MKSDMSLRDKLIDKTIDSIASGLENTSLRSIASAAGCSTTVIFANFKNKSGLFYEVLKYALLEEEKAHKNILDKISSLPSNHQNFSALLLNYIELQDNERSSRLWSEVIFKIKRIPEARDFIKNWYEIRLNFWKHLLPESTRKNSFASAVAAYTLIESTYFHTLKHSIEYRILLYESVQTISLHVFSLPVENTRSEILNWLEGTDTSFRFDAAPQERNYLGKTLLDKAVKQMITNGFDSINVRSIAKSEGTSSAMISYHFGSMDAFVSEAVWQTLLHVMPEVMNPLLTDSVDPSQHWLDTITELVNKRKDGELIYLRVARFIGQAILHARRDKVLDPIVQTLRIKEGVSIYHIFHSAAHPADGIFKRSQANVMGMWLKGQVVINNLIDNKSGITKDRIISVASFNS